MKPKYPVYVPTKGRWETPYTIRALQKIGVSFNAVVEPQEVEHYAPVVGIENILTLPHRDKGLVVTRNWIWDHAQASGVQRFWTFDDNIKGFMRVQGNRKYRLASGTFLAVIEGFTDRYMNLPVVGMCYQFFVKHRQKVPPFILNTRVYSNMLIDANVSDGHRRPYRNEGFYNDDTDLCLRLLKDGWCTLQFCAFTADKQATMTVKGGMTPHYQGDGRYKMALELQQKHPDVVKIVRKFGRWQHQVDYRRFRNNQLIRKPGVVIPEGVNDYGMKLVHVD